MCRMGASGSFKYTTVVCVWMYSSGMCRLINQSINQSSRLNPTGLNVSHHSSSTVISTVSNSPHLRDSVTISIIQKVCFYQSINQSLIKLTEYYIPPGFMGMSSFSYGIMHLTISFYIPVVIIAFCYRFVARLHDTVI